VWADLLSRMEEQVVQPLANYVNQFSEMKVSKHFEMLILECVARKCLYLITLDPSGSKF